jgi:TolB-like protein
MIRRAFVNRSVFYAWLGVLSLGVVCVPSLGLAEDVTALVLYFDNNTGDAKYDVLQKGLADMMITDLAGVEGLRVVEREKLDALVGELKLQQSRFFDKKTALKMGKGVGATHAITGAFVAFSPKIRIDIRLVDVATGEVVLSDKVVGTSGRVLELQQTLVERFVSGLNRTFKRSTSEQGLGLSDVLDYSEALDEADKGDLKAASSSMGKVVVKAPAFQLAKVRYGEILKRLHAARSNRTRVQKTAAHVLFARITRILKETDHRKLDFMQVRGYMAYRVLRSQVILVILKGLTRKQGNDDVRPILRDRKDEAIQWMKAYVENLQTLRADLEGMRASKPRKISGLPMGASSMLADLPMAMPLLAKKDMELATEIDVHMPGMVSGELIPSQLQCDMATFILTGDGGAFSVMDGLKVTPSLSQLDPSQTAVALSLLVRAGADVDKHAKGSQKGSSAVQVYDCIGEAYMQMGRKMDAIARWQIILERFPQSPLYDYIESKIHRSLGVNEE